ncbi:MAG: hypothetical protein FWF70_06935 [Bacteroidetes bacterium]|nr:hypothetical protein [Bacteroidota bacterium]MCL1968032.1 hypothetical protein [Bacteroidota bacterium]
MNSKLWHDRFMEVLHEKFPKNNELVEELCTLLCIERPAAYRRIRNDVPFTAGEIAVMAANWGISLDDIVGIYSGKVAFQMVPINYTNPSSQDIINLQNRVRSLEALKEDPNSEYMVITNNLSRSMATGFDMLYKFNIFKWGYEFSNVDANTPLSDIVVSQEIHNIVRQFYQKMKDSVTTNIILDPMLFDNFVSEVLFFHSIMLITDEEKKIIKNELNNLIDYMIEVASTGCFPETKNKVYLYISTLNINTNYSYIYTDRFKVCRIHAFNKYDILSYNPDMIETFKTWMQKKKRTSILISEVDEKNRLVYFQRLRALIDSL